MAIGDHVLYNGRRYLLIGIDPMSVTGRRAQLEDLETGERVRAPLDEVQDVPPLRRIRAGVREKPLS